MFQKAPPKGGSLEVGCGKEGESQISNFRFIHTRSLSPCGDCTFSTRNRKRHGLRQLVLEAVTAIQVQVNVRLLAVIVAALDRHEAGRSVHVLDVADRVDLHRDQPRLHHVHSLARLAASPANRLDFFLVVVVVTAVVPGPLLPVLTAVVDVQAQGELVES